MKLDKLKIEDAQLWYEYQSNKELFPHVNLPVMKQVDDAVAHIEKMNKGMERNDYVIWSMLYDGKIIGSVCIWNFNYETEVAELGYSLFSNRGKGFMTEAIKEVERYGFDELGLKKIEAFTNIKNTPSRNLLSGLSYKHVDTITEDGEELTVYSKEV